MNRTYRLIFNRSLGLMQVASERAAGRGGKPAPSARRLARRQRVRRAAALLLGTLSAGAVQAQTPNWISGFGSGYWQQESNWLDGLVPNGVGDRAVFGAPGAPTFVSVYLSDQVVLEGITFTANARQLTFFTSSHMMFFRSEGITNNSGRQQTFQVQGRLGFSQQSTAGVDTRYVVSNGGTMQMQNQSTLADATVVVETGGILNLLQESTGGDVRMILNGGVVTVEQSTGLMTMGSLEGQGRIHFRDQVGGAQVHSLTVGSLNTDTVYSGWLDTAVGVDASLTKIGSGTLTLSGDNSYGLGTTVTGGHIGSGACPGFRPRRRDGCLGGHLGFAGWHRANQPQHDHR